MLCLCRPVVLKVVVMDSVSRPMHSALVGTAGLKGLCRTIRGDQGHFGAR